LIRILEYLDREGRSVYAKWFESLNHVAAAKIATALYQLSEGNFSNVNTKQRQQAAIAAALERWRDYQRRKK
jgi:hypothetical protein